MYLVAVIDWYSRYVLAWQLSNTLDGLFCLDALELALAQGRPDIFNTDQGAQFTALAFTSRLETAGIRISMDGRGRALDNVFVERLWHWKRACASTLGSTTTSVRIRVYRIRLLRRCIRRASAARSRHRSLAYFGHFVVLTKGSTLVLETPTSKQTNPNLNNKPFGGRDSLMFFLPKMILMPDWIEGKNALKGLNRQSI